MSRLALPALLFALLLTGLTALGSTPEAGTNGHDMAAASRQ